MQQLGPCFTTAEAHVLSARDSTITEDMAMESLVLQRRGVPIEDPMQSKRRK